MEAISRANRFRFVWVGTASICAGYGGRAGVSDEQHARVSARLALDTMPDAVARTRWQGRLSLHRRCTVRDHPAKRHQGPVPRPGVRLDLQHALQLSLLLLSLVLHGGHPGAQARQAAAFLGRQGERKVDRHHCCRRPRHRCTGRYRIEALHHPAFERDRAHADLRHAESKEQAGRRRQGGHKTAWLGQRIGRRGWLCRVSRNHGRAAPDRRRKGLAGLVVGIRNCSHAEHLAGADVLQHQRRIDATHPQGAPGKAIVAADVRHLGHRKQHLDHDRLPAHPVQDASAVEESVGTKDVPQPAGCAAQDHQARWARGPLPGPRHAAAQRSFQLRNNDDGQGTHRDAVCHALPRRAQQEGGAGMSGCLYAVNTTLLGCMNRLAGASAGANVRLLEWKRRPNLHMQQQPFCRCMALSCTPNFLAALQQRRADVRCRKCQKGGVT
ncbi:hypothetical protein L1887_42326 [Cichorium endivia]|nr:hypothetical protein L1887_42326 [Cichorium endivia]